MQQTNINPDTQTDLVHFGARIPEYLRRRVKVFVATRDIAAQTVLAEALELRLAQGEKEGSKHV
jgi:hypothetical protein